MIKVLYIGQDLGYFENLKKRFLAVNEDMEFRILWPQDLERFHALGAEVLKELPNIAFLDYSSHPLKVMTLARSLPRLFDRGPNLIGLWDQKAKSEWFLESLTLGIPFTHIKGPEFGDIIEQAFFLYNDNQFPDGVFTKAEIMTKSVAVRSSALFRIGYLSEDYLHVEHDFLPPQNREFTLNHSIDDFPIELFSCERRLDHNYYYEMAFSSDYRYVYIADKDVVNSEDYKDKSKSEYQKAQWEENSQKEKIANRISKVESIIDTNGQVSLPKRTRVLVIDEGLDLLKQAPKPLDSYPYSIRFYRYFKNHPNVFNRVRPGIVVYQCPEKQVGELDEIIEGLKKQEGITPFVFVFQSSWTSEYLQKHYGYERVIAWKDVFNFEQMIKFCESYHGKLGREKSHKQETSYHDKEKRLYLRKDAPESFAEYPFIINLNSLCETWVSFSSKEEFVLWSQIRVHEPVSFALTVIEKEQEKEGFSYRGVIHGIGEKERANLRRAINQLIYQQIESETES